MSMATLKMIFPCKKPRRSHRLENKEKTECISRTINDGPLGYFEILPMEVKFLVFTYLPGRYRLVLGIDFFFMFDDLNN